MSASVTVTGLDELKRFFQTASQEMRAEAMGVIQQTTEQAAADIRRAYPVGPTGNLSRRVRTNYPSSAVLVGVVSSAAPHSHLYEFGTKVRRNKRGANRGRMPATPVTPVMAQPRRAAMVRRLIEIVKAKGFEITDVS